jgi:5-methylcytosine-specific restriction endonuclease McrA
VFGWLTRRADDLFGRSGSWATVRRKHLQGEPQCAACGRSKDLEVHHIQPYHLRPELELDAANLITMCRDCHLSVGHAYDWKAYRPDVRSLAATIRSAKVVTPN